MPATPPGQTRERIFRFVRQRLLRGDSPSLREIRDHFGFRALETVRAHLIALVREGKLLREPGRARGYRLPPSPFPDAIPQDPEPARGTRWSTGPLIQAVPGPAAIPLLGEVAAGGFEEAIENPEGFVPVDLPASRDPEQFLALRVRGESMSGAGILPGDTVIVECGIEPANGQVVVALVEGEATVKRFHRNAQGLELRPENPDFEVLRPDPGSCRILGRVVELRRHLG